MALKLRQAVVKAMIVVYSKWAVKFCVHTLLIPNFLGPHIKVIGMFMNKRVTVWFTIRYKDQENVSSVDICDKEASGRNGPKFTVHHIAQIAAFFLPLFKRRHIANSLVEHYQSKEPSKRKSKLITCYIPVFQGQGAREAMPLSFVFARHHLSYAAIRPPHDAPPMHIVVSTWFFRFKSQGLPAHFYFFNYI